MSGKVWRTKPYIRPLTMACIPKRPERPMAPTSEVNVMEKTKLKAHQTAEAKARLPSKTLHGINSTLRSQHKGPAPSWWPEMKATMAVWTVHPNPGDWFINSVKLLSWKCARKKYTMNKKNHILAIFCILILLLHTFMCRVILTIF